MRGAFRKKIDYCRPLTLILILQGDVVSPAHSGRELRRPGRCAAHGLPPRTGRQPTELRSKGLHLVAATGSNGNSSNARRR